MLTESEIKELEKHLQSLKIDLPQGLEIEEAGIAIVRFCLYKALRNVTTNQQFISKTGSKLSPNHP